MEQMQASNVPHIVQVYQSPTDAKMHDIQIIHISPTSLQSSQGNQTLTSKPIHMPVTRDEMHNHQIVSQNIVMSCHQTQLQNVPLSTLQSQALPNDMPLQISSVMLPSVPVFKQHVIVNGIDQYYGPYEYEKEDMAKEEPDIQVIGEMNEKQTVNPEPEIYEHPKKRIRRDVPNPNKWACNIRKLKHQRGEAYFNRRGKYVPEKQVKTFKDCVKSCRYKCNERISDSDRKELFKAFYSLDTNGKKYFILNTTERLCTHRMEFSGTQDVKRKYCFKYYFSVRDVKYSVCKKFYLGTLSISQKPVYNVHLSKSDSNIPKPDGRGLAVNSIHGLPPEMKDRVRKHIQTFQNIDSKPLKHYPKKRQYLDVNLNITQMYNMYLTECSKESVSVVKQYMYRKIAKEEFNLGTKKVKSKVLCCSCKGVVKKK